MASTIKIVSHLIPPYINYSSPIYSQYHSSKSKLEWTYLLINLLEQTTTFNFYTSIDNNDNNIINSTYKISGLWNLIT